MKRRRRSKTTQVEPLRKFQPGQRVQISPAGIEFGLLAPGTKGTVVYCGFSAKVLVDGVPREQLFPPDFWEAEA